MRVVEYQQQGMRSFERGGLTEAVVLSSLAKAGYTVLVPFGVARYDLAIDARDGRGLKTVQCKTGRIRNGCIIWATCSNHTLTYVRTSYRGQVDYFGVWCPEFGEDAYLVPVDAVGEREGALRITEPKIRVRQSGLRWAKDFTINTLNGM